MKNIIALLLAIFVLDLPCMAQEKPRVDDSSKYYLTIITHADWAKRPAEKKLIADMESQPMLKVAQGCHFNHYTTKDAIYQNRWASIYPEDKLPVLILQDANGGYYFKGSGKNVPSGSQKIFDTLKAFRDMDPGSRAEAFSLMEFTPEPDPAVYSDDQELRNPLLRRPKVDEQAPDSIELFGGKTPVRDTLSSAAMIFLAILAIGLVMCLGVMALVAFFLVVKYWK